MKGEQTMALRTPFYCNYLEHKANIMEIFNWDLPYDFGSVEEELKMVRQRAGFIDYSFQNEIAMVGKDAFHFLQKLLVNDLNKIRPGKAIYSTLLDETGSVIDDVTVFWVEENYFLFNGGLRKARVDEWLTKHAQAFDVYLIKTGLCLLAFQGPKSREILQKSLNVEDLTYYSLKRDTINDIPVLVARVGYSGELGYEFYTLPEFTTNLWGTLLEIGKDHQAGPYGLGATGLLGIEKGFLGGSDFYEGSSPLELGLEWTVAFDKGDFFGKEALLKRKTDGLKTKLIAFESLDPQVLGAENDKLFKNDKQAGRVTKAGPGPTLGKASIGRGWVNIEYANEGEELEMEHDGKKTGIRVTLQRDWYDPENKKVKG